MAKNETKDFQEKKGEAGENTEAQASDGAAPAESKSKENKGVAEKDDVVEINKVDLRNFLKRMEDLEESNRRLLAVADKGRMFQISEKERKEQTSIPTVKLTRMGSESGKLVVAWKMGKNESYVQGNRLVEHQTMILFYQDGTSEEVPLIDFYRQQNKDTVAKIIARTKSEDGTETLRLELVSNGEVLDVGLKFIN